MTPKTRRKRRTISPAMRARNAEGMASAKALRKTYAGLLLNDPDELHAFLVIAASVGVKYDFDDEDAVGYSPKNVVLLAAQRRPITHCGSYDYWKAQGRHVMQGEKSMVTLHPAKRRKTDEEKEADRRAAEDGLTGMKPKVIYFPRGGTYDVRQTRPIRECPYCGTTPTGEDDRETQCPPTCGVFAPRNLTGFSLQDALTLLGAIADPDDGGEFDE